MISSIRLKNWRTHKDTRLEFGNGINLLVGVMGSGKSSVMDAISFALFGTFPALKRGAFKIDSLIMDRPSQESQSEISLSLEIDGEHYQVTRTIQKKGSTATLTRNGSVFQTQPERVNEEISRILKVDYDVFSRAIYSEQNGLLYFLDITKGERKRQIDGMLGLDNFAKAEERITTVINSIRSMLEDEEQIVANMDVESMRKLLQSSNDALQRERESFRSIRTELEEKTKEMDSAKADLEKVREAYNRRMKVLSEIEKAKARKETIEKEMDKLGKQSVEEDGVESLIVEAARTELKAKTAYEKALSAERELIRTIASCRSEIEHAQKSAEEKRKIGEELGRLDEDRLKAECDTLEKRMEELAKENAVMERKLKETMEWVRELKKHISVCPVCEREIDAQLKEALLKGKDALVSETAARIEQISSDIKKLRVERSKKSDAYAGAISLRKRLSSYGDVERQVETLKAKLPELEAGLDQLGKSKRSAEEEMKAAGERAQQLRFIEDRANRRKRLAAELGNTSASLDTLKHEALGEKADMEALNFHQERYAKLDGDVGIIRTKMDNAASLISKLSEDVKNREVEIGKLSAIKERINRRSSYLENLSKFKKALGSTSSSLRSSLIFSINETMARLWDELYPYGDYKSIRINAENEDYSLEACVVRDEDESWMPIGSVASGGEKSVACLAMRITMGMVIVPNLRWTILDEPTHNIDSNGIYRLVSVFGESLPRILEQVFIITHDEKLKQISNAKVYLLERDKEKGSYTTVSAL